MDHGLGDSHKNVISVATMEATQEHPGRFAPSPGIQQGQSGQHNLPQLDIPGLGQGALYPDCLTDSFVEVRPQFLQISFVGQSGCPAASSQGGWLAVVPLPLLRAVGLQLSRCLFSGRSACGCPAASSPSADTQHR